MVNRNRTARIILAAGITLFLTMGLVTGVSAQSGTRLYALTMSPATQFTPAENTIEIVDLDTLTTIKSIPITSGKVTSLAVSPDENRLYVTFNFFSRPLRSGIAVYDAQNGNEISAILFSQPRDSVRDSVISADGSTLYVTAGSDGIIAIDTTTNTIWKTLPTSPDIMLSIALSPDGMTLAATMLKPFLALIDATTLTLVDRVPITNPGDSTNCGTYSNDVVFTGTGVVLLWDSNCDNLYQVDVATTSQDTGKTIRLGRDNGASFNYNNMLLYSSTTAQSFVLKESDELAVMDPAGASFRLFGGFSATPFAPALSPDGTKLYIALIGGKLDRFDVLTRQFAKGIYTFSNTSGMIRDAHILPSTTQAVTGICLSGAIPVVIFSSDDIDVENIRIESMEFGGATPLNCKMRDVNKDRDEDLVCTFRSGDIASNAGGTEATLSAETYDGKQIRGSDILNVIDRNCVRRNNHDDDDDDDSDE